MKVRVFADFKSPQIVSELRDVLATLPQDAAVSMGPIVDGIRVAWEEER